MPNSLPNIILEELRKHEPDAEFTGSLPTIKSSSGKSFYVKTGGGHELEQFAGEAESLIAIGVAAPGLAPRLIAHGEADGKPYFISEYKNLGRLTGKSEQLLAKRLATELHTDKGLHGFGFHVPTFCGATRQKNGWYDSWEHCYSEMIGDLLAELKRRGGYEDLCRKGENVRKEVIPKLLGPLVIQPVLLHGDLWSGNAGTDEQTGEPIIFDASSFYGHNEADLAIARIFGGFSSSFFETYHKQHPKTEPVDRYGLRSELYQLYHYLNHTVLFGGSYASSAMSKIDTLLGAKL